MFGFYGPKATHRTPLPTGESEAARAERLALVNDHDSTSTPNPKGDRHDRDHHPLAL
jgi:hypothetical protein